MIERYHVGIWREHRQGELRYTKNVVIDHRGQAVCYADTPEWAEEMRQALESALAAWPPTDDVLTCMCQDCQQARSYATTAWRAIPGQYTGEVDIQGAPIGPFGALWNQQHG